VIRATVPDGVARCAVGDGRPGARWPHGRPTPPVPGEVDVWRMDCTPTPDRVRAAAALLDEEETARARAMRSPGTADRFVVARGRTRRLLGAIVGVDPRALRFERHCAVCGEDGHGRPRLLGDAGAGLHFSLSHAVDLALVAVGRDPRLGVDVEAISRAGDPAVGPGFLAPEEEATIAAMPLAERPAAATRCWCRKEALLKGHAVGMVGDLGDLSMAPEEPWRVSCSGIRGATGEGWDGRTEPDGVRWELVTMEPRRGYRAAVAAPGSWTPRCRTFPG
jgi:4'-phosphopantetheinyl transferase